MNILKVSYSRRFKKQYKKCPKIIREKFHRRLSALVYGEDVIALRIHKLHGMFAGCYSMNVTGDIRAVFQRVGNNKIDFIAIGSHSELYL